MSACGRIPWVVALFRVLQLSRRQCRLSCEVSQKVQGPAVLLCKQCRLREMLQHHTDMAAHRQGFWPLHRQRLVECGTLSNDLRWVSYLRGKPVGILSLLTALCVLPGPELWLGCAEANGIFEVPPGSCSCAFSCC